MVVITNGSSPSFAQSGDYDRDGKAELALWTEASRTRSIVGSAGQHQQTQQRGTSSDLTLWGDYDGDRQSLAIFRV